MIRLPILILPRVQLSSYLYALQTVAAIASCVLHLLRFAAASDEGETLLRSSSASASANANTSSITELTFALTSPKLVAALCHQARVSVSAAAASAPNLRAHCEALLDCLRHIQLHLSSSSAAATDGPENSAPTATSTSTTATASASPSSSSSAVPDADPRALVQSTIDLYVTHLI